MHHWTQAPALNPAPQPFMHLDDWFDWEPDLDEDLFLLSPSDLTDEDIEIQMAEIDWNEVKAQSRQTTNPF